MTRLKYSLLLPLIATLINCTATGLGDASLEQRRQNVLTMRQEVLAELYGLKPDTECRSTALQVTPYSPMPTSI